MGILLKFGIRKFDTASRIKKNKKPTVFQIIIDGIVL